MKTSCNKTVSSLLYNVFFLPNRGLFAGSTNSAMTAAAATVASVTATADPLASSKPKKDAHPGMNLGLLKTHRDTIERKTTATHFSLQDMGPRDSYADLVRLRHYFSRGMNDGMLTYCN